VSKQDATDLNLPADKGALVQQVTSGSPAAKAGLHAGRTQTSTGLVAGGDLIVEVDGKPIGEPQDIATAIADKKPGDRIEIKFFRGKKQQSVTLTLGKRPSKVPGQDSGGGSQPFPNIP
jgi:2-alkenal reductase